MDGCHDDKFRAWCILTGTCDDVLSGMFLDLLTADGRIGSTNAGIEQTQIFVYLGSRANGGTRIARDNFLFDGDSGRYALDKVALGFVHAPQELTGIRRQTLHIAALTLSVECVESQRRLAAA